MAWFNPFRRAAPNPQQVLPLAAPKAAPGKAGPAAGLIGLIGLTATIWLLDITPEDESGREVEVTVSQSGEVDLRHVRGPMFLKAYLDLAGVATACDGLADRDRIKLGQTYTEAQCTEMLIQALYVHAKGVMACTPRLHAAGMDFQRVAAVAFAYNLGIGAWCGSSAKRYFDAGDTVRAANNLLPWNKAKVGLKNVPAYRRRGETCAQSRGIWRCTVRGLTNRRHRDREYMLTGTPGYPVSTLKQRVEKWK